MSLDKRWEARKSSKLRDIGKNCRMTLTHGEQQREGALRHLGWRPNLNRWKKNNLTTRPSRENCEATAKLSPMLVCFHPLQPPSPMRPLGPPIKRENSGRHPPVNPPEQCWTLFFTGPDYDTCTTVAVYDCCCARLLMCTTIDVHDCWCVRLLMCTNGPV